MFDSAQTSTEGIAGALRAAFGAGEWPPPRPLRRAALARPRPPKPATQEEPTTTALAALEARAESRDAVALAASTNEGVPWHHLTAENVARRLATDAEHGLVARSAAQRLRRAGRNEIPDIPRRPRAAM